MNNVPSRLPAMKTAQYEPQLGDVITVQLPDERVRAVIEGIVSDTAVTARLQNHSVSRSHNYRKGDLVACRFEKTEVGPRCWIAIPERELQQATEPKRKRRKRE